MIYIVASINIQKKNLYIHKKIDGNDSIFLQSQETTKQNLLEYASSVNLFGVSPTIVIEGFLKEGKDTLLAKDLKIIQESNTIFIFSEDILKIADQKKYEKYATIEIYTEKKVTQTPRINVFAIADAYGRKDKVGTWVLYREAIDKGTEPEAIAGMIFWKIKTLLLSGTIVFNKKLLKKYSGELVELYHESHQGKKDFPIALEQFILSTLS